MIPLVSVCICTFRRPGALSALLESLEQQRVLEAFTFEVVIVDNDERRSAEPVAAEAAARGIVQVAYDVEPLQNISLARNRVVRNAQGSLIALIDDDELPASLWLEHLFLAYGRFSVDGVLGPVVPDIPVEAPAWIRRGRFLDRPRHLTGTPITLRDARTGNALLRRDIFEGCWFDPAFGRTGGEDSDFFRRQLASGRRFVWCDEATVSEAVPIQRLTIGYHVRRRMTTGLVTGARLRRTSEFAPATLAVNLVGLAACGAASLPSLLAPKHLRVRVLQKAAYCAGVIGGWAGMSPGNRDWLVPAGAEGTNQPPAAS